MNFLGADVALERQVTHLPPSSPPLALLGFGTQIVAPGADLGPIGMTGCFELTNLDLGLFGPAAGSSSLVPLPLPIPAIPSLAGTVRSVQGVAFSTANALGLASTNGIRLVLTP